MSEELDARVAVEVMGWTLVIPASETMMSAPYFECGLPHMQMRNQQDWNPFTSWADSGLVVEEMRRRGAEDFGVEHMAGWGWMAYFKFPDLTTGRVEKIDTAHEAICLAALEAVK